MKLTREEQAVVAVAAVAATSETAELIAIIERLSGEIVTPAGERTRYDFGDDRTEQRGRWLP